MPFSPRERALLPLIALQGVAGTLGGFIGYFVMVSHDHDMHAMFRYTAIMLTAAMGATALAYIVGPRLRIDSARMFRLGFVLPGALLAAGVESIPLLAIAYGSYVGMTWSARHALEMALLQDKERDGYAAHSCTLMVVAGIGATLLATALLAHSAEHSGVLFRVYGLACIAGGLLLGRALPTTEPLRLHRPLAVLRQPQFLACLPLFFLESGLFGISQALASAGAASALHSASDFGMVATVAGLVGGLALFLTRRNRDVGNRANWLGGACAAVGTSFVLLGASAWIPALYVAYSVVRSASQPFLLASEQVLNQRTLDIDGTLSDRIFAREFVLWALRMISLGMFWALAGTLPPEHILAIGSLLMATATFFEYLVGKSMFESRGSQQPA